MINNIFNHKTKNITSAAIILIGATFFSKVIAIIRDRILASLFGAGRELDIYYSAFRIPDFVFNILIIGALSSALIPVFAEYWEKKSEEEAWRLFNNVLFIFVGIMIVVSIFFVIFAPQIMRIIVPGFQSKDFQMVVLLTRIMFISPLILTFSNIFGCVLQYFSRFLIYSIAPIMYNIGIIVGALFFVPRMGITGLAVGVVLGAFLHFLIQLPAVFMSGFNFKFIFSFSEKGIRKIFKLMAPRAIGVAATQINLIVINAIASILAVGSIAVFNFANNIQYAPVSLFGISFAIAAFPALSKTFSLGESKKFIDKFSLSFSQIIFFIVPISFLVFILRAQIVRVLLGAGEFSWNDTRLTAACLGVFSFSIFAQALIPLISQSFYATQETKTPVEINIFSIIFNIVFSFSFVWIISKIPAIKFFFESLFKLEGVKGISVLGLPLAFSLTSILNMFWLIHAFKKRVGNHWDFRLRNSFLRIFLLSFSCAGFCYGLLYLFAPILGLETFLGVFLQLFFAGGISLVFYFYLAKKLGFPEYSLITRALFKKVAHEANIIEVEAEP